MLYIETEIHVNTLGFSHSIWEAIFLFWPEESWSKPSSANILAEQHHFSISHFHWVRSDANKWNLGPWVSASHIQIHGDIIYDEIRKILWNISQSCNNIENATWKCFLNSDEYKNNVNISFIYSFGGIAFYGAFIEAILPSLHSTFICVWILAVNVLIRFHTHDVV